MSQFLSNKYLRYRGLDQTPGRMIDNDHPCSNCSYNLRGLMNTGACPECGTPIKISPPARMSLLSDAPVSDIRKLACGLWMGIASLVGLPVAVIASYLLALRFNPAGSGDYVMWALLSLALLWAMGVWNMTPVLQTPEGTKHGFTPKSPTRQIARFSQIGWVLAVILLMMPPGAAFPVGIGIAGSICLGLGGLVALSLMLGRLADWSCDEPAGGMLNVTVWLLPLATGLLLLAPVFPFAGFFSCLAVLMWMFAAGAFTLAMLSLAVSAAWSIRHAHERNSKEQALRDRIVHRPPLPPIPDGPIKLAKPGDPMPSVGLADLDDGLAKVSLDEILRDVACQECGYNLRGLKVYGRCPECGERIASA